MFSEKWKNIRGVERFLDEVMQRVFSVERLQSFLRLPPAYPKIAKQLNKNEEWLAQAVCGRFFV